MTPEKIEKQVLNDSLNKKIIKTMEKITPTTKKIIKKKKN